MDHNSHICKEAAGVSAYIFVFVRLFLHLATSVAESQKEFFERKNIDPE
jgi:hypothetical protein